VSAEAADYQNKIKEQEKAEQDAHAYDNMDEEAMVQLSAKHDAPVALAQTKSNGWLANLEKLGLSSEQREYLEAMTDANDPDIQ
jgi:hypothetical protein